MIQGYVVCAGTTPGSPTLVL